MGLLRPALAGLTVCVFAACGSSGNGADATSGEGGPDAAVDGATDDGSDSDSDAASRDGSVPGSCDAFGLYGSPGKTFTLPVPTDGHLSHPDLAASFPSVDWGTVDRLYISAGKYKSILLGNLPKRAAARPLVITNLGGQVAVGPNDPGAGYLWSITGGSNWIVTGRYDPDSGTGDAKFPGHRCGAYASSQGTYGFLSDDAYATGQYLHMGIAVRAATSFELEFLEIYRSGFAGISLLNPRGAGDPASPMENVRVHDNYVHDVGGEGFYFGWTGAPPSNLFPKLSIYNNRILRSGNEGLQIQDLGEGSEVHHNVVAWSALHWRDNGLGAYQDNNAQIQVREGTIAIHDNVFVGASNALLGFFAQPEPGDGPRHVTFRDNFFADTLLLGGFVNGTSGGESSLAFDHNFFRGLAFGYDKLDPGATAPGNVFNMADSFKAVTTFTNNTYEGGRKLVRGLGASESSGNVTTTGNINGAVIGLAFAGSDNLDADPSKHLEAWAPVATLAPGQPAIVYEPGEKVMHDGDLYECLASSSKETPPDHPLAWKKLARPVDDVRAAASSPYAAMGVH